MDSIIKRGFKLIAISIFLSEFLSLLSSSASANSGEKQIIEAENAKPMGGASKLADNSASGKYLASLTEAGQAVTFANVPAANKLAIRYASIKVGTISVAVNNQPPVKVNIHSSGATTGSFLYAIIDVTIPAHSSLTVSVDTNDVALNIDRIEVGNGDLGLAPDIWNLSAITSSDGPFPCRLERNEPHLYCTGMVA